MKTYLDGLKEYARDTKLNLGTVLTPEGAPGLNLNQILGIALASAYSTRSPGITQAMEELTAGQMSDAEQLAARSAATVMAMNNVYYRALHLVEDESLSQLPARLRMNALGKPGIPKTDFELECLAVSAISGCGKCLKAHVAEAKKAGVSVEGIQSALRIASVVNSAAQADAIG